MKPISTSKPINTSKPISTSNNPISTSKERRMAAAFLAGALEVITGT